MGGSRLWIANFLHGIFSYAIDDVRLKRCGPITIWNKIVPSKVRILNWRCNLNRLPTKDNLTMKGAVMDNLLRPLCKELSESLDHLFASCSKSKEVRIKLNSWWKV